MTASGSGLSNKSYTLHIPTVEPVALPPLSQALGEIHFDVKSSESSECNILAAVALTPGNLKHGKGVERTHLHVYRAHTHAEILKKNAKQHGIRLTGEFVSCSACLMAEGQRACTPRGS